MSDFPPPPGGNPPPPPPMQPPPPGSYGPPPVAPGNNQKALWALITGILGFICCCWPAGLAALVLGFIARKEIQTSGGTQGGGGMAIAGIVLGALSVVLSIVLTILYFAGVVTYNFDASTTGY
ncbi:MAG TPA: DUF4190 domain-containing protein [Marmoricola sp.]|nr:DUF4190 domain-containing protein [Marmoricola sp.]